MEDLNKNNIKMIGVEGDESFSIEESYKLVEDVLATLIFSYAT